MGVVREAIVPDPRDPLRGPSGDFSRRTFQSHFRVAFRQVEGRVREVRAHQLRPGERGRACDEAGDPRRTSARCRCTRQYHGEGRHRREVQRRRTGQRRPLLDVGRQEAWQ